jgi:hypothetical protein
MSDGRPDFRLRRCCLAHGPLNGVNSLSNVGRLTPVRRTKLGLARSRVAENGRDIRPGTFAGKVPDESNRPVTCQPPGSQALSHHQKEDFRNRSSDEQQNDYAILRGLGLIEYIDTGYFVVVEQWKIKVMAHYVSPLGLNFVQACGVQADNPN